MDSAQVRSRFRGCFLGLACGDALGAGIEFMAPEAIQARFGVVTEFAGGGPFNWPVGAYTDDTQMSLDLAVSLIAHEGANLSDIAKQWYEWLETNPPDVGGLTRDALNRVPRCLRENLSIVEAGRGAWELSGRDAAGNGGIMRTAPVGMAYCQRLGDLRRVADDICAITHFDPRCRASCIAFSTAIAQALLGEVSLDLAQLASDIESLSPPTAVAIRDVFDMELRDLSTTGYTLDTLQAGLWPLERGMKYEDGVIAIVNLGNDADTTAACAGALLGARHGEEAIPQRWISKLRHAEQIRAVADELFTLAMER